MKTHLLFRCMLIVILCISLVSCSTVQMEKWNKDPAAKLSDYKTFDLYDIHTPGDFPMEYQPRVDMIRKEMIKYMESLGLKHVKENPDLLVNIGVVVEQKIQTRETTIRDAPAYMGQRNYSWQAGEVEVGRYEQGTVTLDWVDRVQSKMMWHFVLTNVVAKKTSSTPKNIEEGKKLISKKLNAK